MRRLSYLVFTLLLTSVAVPSFAYVLPSEALVRFLVDKRKQMNVRDITVQFSSEISGQDTAVDEKAYLKVPERFRLVRSTDDTPWVYIEKEGARAEGPENALVRQKNSGDLVTALLMPQLGKDVDEAVSRILTQLKNAGVNTQIVSLGRFNDTIAYVIGAHSYEKDKPQVWLYKSTLQPLRIILPEKIGDKTSYLETRLLEYGSSLTGDWFPQVIENYRDGIRVRRAEVQKLQINQDLSESLFELPKK